MALPTLPILLFIVILPTSCAHALSFSLPVYHQRRYIDNSTFSQSKVHSDSHSNHEDLLVMSVGIGSNYDGTPLLTTELAVDTGSSLLWLQAQPCKRCYDQGRFPYYNSSVSTSYNPVLCQDWVCSIIPEADHRCRDLRWDTDEPCSYTARYADETNSSGIIGSETVYFQKPPAYPGPINVSVENVPFGLGFSNYIPNNLRYKHSVPGVAGLIRGAGLLGKLGVKKFSHCFPKEERDTGIVSFGEEAIIAGVKLALRTNSRFYMALLTSVYVADKWVQVDLDELPNEMVFDTGATTTFLAPKIMDAVVAAIKAGIGRRYWSHQWKDYELCYNMISLCSVSLDQVAKVTFEFDYSTKIDLFSFHLWVRDRGNNQMCLGFHRSKTGQNIFGNNLMREVNVGYTLDDDDLAMYFNHQACWR